jgi:hypothetical protein
MSTDFTLEFNGEYIHIVHPPGYEITPASQGKVWTELSRACRQRACLKVLVEGPAPTRRMGTMDGFESGTQAAQAIPGLTLAICFQGYMVDETSRLFTNVAHNRGARIEFFTDRKQALEWLGVEDAE